MSRPARSNMYESPELMEPRWETREKEGHDALNTAQTATF